jgi:hypothetical protein
VRTFNRRAVDRATLLSAFPRSPLSLTKKHRHSDRLFLSPQETKLLQTIDRLKLAAGKENRSTRIARTLASMAAPKQWELQNGNKVEVQTPLTVRAAELMQVGGPRPCIWQVVGIRRTWQEGNGLGRARRVRALQSWLVCRS